MKRGCVVTLNPTTQPRFVWDGEVKPQADIGKAHAAKGKAHAAKGRADAAKGRAVASKGRAVAAKGKAIAAQGRAGHRPYASRPDSRRRTNHMAGDKKAG